MQKIILLACIGLLFSLHAKESPYHRELEVTGDEEVQAPWFTGPLLAPSAVVIPLGHINIEPYLSVVANQGRYNDDWSFVKAPTFWSVVNQLTFQVGIARGMGFFINPTVSYNYKEGASQWHLADLPFGIDIQLYKSRGEVTDWITSLKLFLKEVAPVGEYQKLDVRKLGVDVGGQGSWQSSAGLVWGNLVYLSGIHFLSTRLSFGYTWFAPVSVKGLNVYGGGAGTEGTVYPGQSFELDFALEYNITKNWAFSMDVVGRHVLEKRFSGVTSISNASPSLYQFSLAPAIEYNWSADIGIIFGPWFTVAGKNSIQFATAMVAFNYYH